MPEFIFNGGKPVDDCPKTWKHADTLLEAVTERRLQTLGTQAPVWKWDCGFKLDFDGSFVSVSSRFYPPKEGYGALWDGDMSVLIAGTVKVFEFKENSFQELIKRVEEKETEIRNKLEQAIQSL